MIMSPNDKQNVLALLEAISREDEDAFVAGAVRFLNESKVLDAVRPMTLWEPAKVHTVFDLVLKTESLPGDIVELGIFRGGGTLLIAEMLRALSSNRKVYGIDSFEGLPRPREQDVMPNGEVYYHRGMFGDGSGHGEVANAGYEFVQHLMRLFRVDKHVRLVEGFFEDVLPKFARQGGRYSLVIIDPDQYKGTIDALNALYDRVLPGGYVLIDDYYSKSAVGVAKAAEEFLADKPESVERVGGSMAFFQKQ